MEQISNGAFLKSNNSQMEQFSNGAFLKWSISRMEQFSNQTFLKWSISQMKQFSNRTFLKWSISQMEHSSNRAILKSNISQMEQFSNGAFWGQTPLACCGQCQTLRRHNATCFEIQRWIQCGLMQRSMSRDIFQNINWTKIFFRILQKNKPSVIGSKQNVAICG